jgi:hypothetical protein
MLLMVYAAKPNDGEHAGATSRPRNAPHDIDAEHDQGDEEHGRDGIAQTGTGPGAFQSKRSRQDEGWRITAVLSRATAAPT